MLLSVIIPSYNHHQFILQTLQAANKIGIPDKEIIVIDDGSRDSTVDIVQNYINNSGTTQSVRLIARENRGLVKTLNEGLSLSQGKYIYCVASDDIPIPDGILGLTKVLELAADAQFAIGNALFMSSEDQIEFRAVYGGAHQRFFGLQWHERRKELFLHYPQPILLQSTLFRGSTLKDMGGWREDVISDDMSLFLRMFCRFKNPERDFKFCPDIIACYYRQHNFNVSKNIGRQFRMVEQALEVSCPPDLLDAALLRNSFVHAVTALKTGNVMLAPQIAYKTFIRLGAMNIARAAALETLDTFRSGMSRSKARNWPLIDHQSAAASATHPSNYKDEPCL